jgi:hypothetical protein
MRSYEFDLVLGGIDIEVAASDLDEFERRVDDFTFASHGGAVRAAVGRTAASLGEAIRSAIADAESIPGVRVLRVEPEENVSQSEIAVRLGGRASPCPSGSRVREVAATFHHRRFGQGTSHSGVGVRCRHGPGPTV